MNRRFQYVVVAFSSAVVALLLFGAVGRSASPDSPYTNLGVYSEVLSRIKADYVEEPDMKAVTAGAINGMLEALDPHASYLSADQYKQYLRGKDAKRADVGLVLAKRFGYMAVEDAIPGSPAAEHHAKVWGNCEYDVFVERFLEASQNWDPAHWQQVLAASGAKYCVMVTKHHDGVLLWPSDVPNPLVGLWRRLARQLGEQSRFTQPPVEHLAARPLDALVHDACQPPQ